MAGKTPRKAVNAFIAPIKEAMACFAACKVRVDQWDPEVEGILTINDGERVNLRKRAGMPRIGLELQMRYKIVEHPTKGPWKVNTTGWIHDVYRADKRVMTFHWHPISDSHVKTPHLHASASSTYRKMHIPTGRILVEDVLGLAHELGAQPLDSDWHGVMATNRYNFNLGATWGSVDPPED